MNEKPFLKRYLPGILAITFYCVHAATWLVKGVPANLIWACHLGTLAIGSGFIFRVAVLNAVGTILLVMGNIFWGLYLAGGGEFEFTSLLTHGGSLIIGVYGVYLMNIPRFSWIFTLGSVIVIQIISRFITPEVENVNLAFRVHDGWESIFTEYLWYEVFLFFQSSLTFLLTQIILKWIRRKVAPK